MITRKGCVSNSSSSSFILAISPDGKGPCPTCGIDIDFTAWMNALTDDGYSDSTKLDDANADAVLRYLQGRIDEIHDDLKHCDTSSELYYKEELVELRKRMVAVRKAVKAGWSVIGVTISYHDNMTNRLLESLIKAGRVKEIHSEN